MQRTTLRAQLGAPRHSGCPLRAQAATKAGEVKLRIPKLQAQAFEKAIIERYRRRESSVEEGFDRDVTWPGFRFAASRTSLKPCGVRGCRRRRCRTSTRRFAERLVQPDLGAASPPARSEARAVLEVPTCLRQ